MNNIQLVVTEHALQRAAERQITDTEIIVAFASGRKIKSHARQGIWTSTTAAITVVYQIIGRTVKLLTVYREKNHA